MGIGKQTRVYANKVDPCGIMHITVGDGGNREGLARKCVFYLDFKANIFFSVLHAAVLEIVIPACFGPMGFAT